MKKLIALTAVGLLVSCSTASVKESTDSTKKDSIKIDSVKDSIKIDSIKKDSVK